VDASAASPLADQRNAVIFTITTAWAGTSTEY
jgi:hypothetical protein